ncbi:MAG: alpha/beta hydrolase [Clostridia bacterium]|nr:alpha/beta hydrolase [Clostridia bacterium]
MEKSKAIFQGCDGWGLFLYEWNAVPSPRAAIQILHGMAEHAGRYESFARFLNGQGYVVYAHDHRGQGRSTKNPDDLGKVGKDGFNKTVEDAHLITKRIKEKHPGLPVYLFAHSFGSFVGQDYITRFGKDIDGIVLSGSALQTGPAIQAGVVVASVQRLLFGEKRKGKLINSLSFGSFNKGVENPNSPFDWLSRDTQEVGKYCNDPLCGSIFSIGFSYYLFKGLKKLYGPERLAGIPRTLPICLLAGDRDPVGSYGESVKKLCDLYKSLGVEDVALKLYPGARHEILNETNREEVYHDIAVWLDKHLA